MDEITGDILGTHVGALVASASGVDNSASLDRIETKLDAALNSAVSNPTDTANTSNNETFSISIVATRTNTTSTAATPTANPIYGMNRHTGRLMSGVEHLQQSIRDILITRTNTRVMLRNYGSGLPDKVDRPQNATWLAELFISITEALDEWEPRFLLSSISAEQGEYAGQPIITLTGEAIL